MNAQSKKTINLALQGGGSHGAFTWGVLDRLLADERLEFEGISGTSSGAMNAAVLACGLSSGGRAAAREKLADFWGRIGNEFSGIFSDPSSLSLTRTFSPYQLNPLDMNPLRNLVVGLIDFELLSQHCAVKLFIAATHVRTGKLKIFENREISIDALMASACLPSIHHAVEIEGETYWDGGFSGNPAVFPLIFNCKQNDIVIVMLQPLEIDATPKTAEEIRQRTSDLGFNAAFLREMRAIAFSKKMINKSWLPTGKLESRMDNINIHLIENQALASQYTADSRYNTLPSFINLLYKEGVAAADVWLENNYSRLGTKSSVDLAALFC